MMFFLKFLLPALAYSLVVVPPPSGPFAVSLVDVELTEYGRTDPYTGYPNRTIPISVMFPSGHVKQCQPIQHMYMPETTAQYWEQAFGSAYSISLNNTFTQTVLSLCKTPFHDGKYPLVIFSSGLGAARQFYSVIATNLAAQGFVVITVDTPGETTIVTYLDGSVEYADPNNFNTDAQLTAALDVRVKDIDFILNRLSSEGLAEHGVRQCLETSKPAIFGHSFGGATALSSIVANENFVGGANLDGAFFGAPLTHTTSKPFLIFASDMPGDLQHNQSTVPGWSTVWRNLLGPKWQLQMLNSTHSTFTDIPTLASIWGFYQDPDISEILGSIDPDESLRIQVSTLSTLGEILFDQKSVGSLIDLENTYPAVVVVNATNV